MRKGVIYLESEYFSVSNRLALALATPVGSSEFSERASQGLNLYKEMKKIWKDLTESQQIALEHLHTELEEKIKAVEEAAAVAER
jgi:hypothetical protein